MQGAQERYTDVCLVDSIRALGLKVPYLRSGPLWALKDGNELLKPWGRLGDSKVEIEGFGET